MREVILDTETTGYSKGNVSKSHRIVEIALVELEDGVETGKIFHSYVNPHMKITSKAERIHGISDAFLIGKPAFSSIVIDLLAFIGDSPIVIHNAAFDTAFLDKEFNLLKPSLQPKCVFHVVDTLTMARQMFPGERNDLSSLAKKYSIHINRDKHGALTDCKILAQVYRCLLHEAIVS